MGKRRILTLLVILIAIIESIIIWELVKKLDPDPSVSIAVIIYVPAVFCINMLIGVLLHILKSYYRRVFYTNSIICSISMFFLFGQGVNRYLERTLDSWTFEYNNSEYHLTKWEETGNFSITVRLSEYSEKGYIDGVWELKDNELLLKGKDYTMRLSNGKLRNFNDDNSVIPVEQDVK